MNNSRRNLGKASACPVVKRWTEQRLKHQCLMMEYSDESLCTMFLFKGIEHPDVLHCTHKYFSAFKDEDTLISQLKAYFKENPFTPRTIAFDTEEMFGQENDVRVLRPSGEHLDQFLPDLKSQFDEIEADTYPEYKPHVSVNANMDCCDLEIDRYALVKGGKVIWSTNDNG